MASARSAGDGNPRRETGSCSRPRRGPLTRKKAIKTADRLFSTSPKTTWERLTAAGEASPHHPLPQLGEGRFGRTRGTGRRRRAPVRPNRGEGPLEVRLAD